MITEKQYDLMQEINAIRKESPKHILELSLAGELADIQDRCGKEGHVFTEAGLCGVCWGDKNHV